MLGLGLFGAMTANAQQRPQPLPVDGASSAVHHHAPLPRATFPMTPAHFDLIMDRLLEGVRKMSNAHRNPLAPGDMNTIILRTKECIANVERDGVVTSREANRCSSVIDVALKQHEQQRTNNR